MASLAEHLGYTSTQYDLPGVRLYVVSAGPARGEVVVLLHGFPEFWYGWRRQIPALAQAGFRVLAPDQRGYSLSSKRGPFDLGTLAGDIVYLLDAARVDRAHVVGHDWGGGVAWILAERYPDRLHSLTVLNVPHPYLAMRSVMRGNLPQLGRSLYVLVFNLPWLPERLLSRNRFAALRQAMQATALPGAFSAADLERYVAAWSQPRALTGMLGWYRAFVRGGWMALGRRPGLPRLELPGLILWGERDPALGVELAQQSAELLAQGRLIRFPAATHWVNNDLPDDVNARLIEHFNRARRSG